MDQPIREPQADRLYRRIFDIRDQHANGLWEPVAWHLTLRRHQDTMILLANWLTDRGVSGGAADSFRPTGLLRRAYRSGNFVAAQNLAMDCFNRGDLQGYRCWLRRAARLGDTDSAQELRRFETRLPHGNARKIRRLRPWRRIELR